VFFKIPLSPFSVSPLKVKVKISELKGVKRAKFFINKLKASKKSKPPLIRVSLFGIYEYFRRKLEIITFLAALKKKFAGFLVGPLSAFRIRF